MHSVSANNNLAPFRLWLRENMLKLKKISRFPSTCYFFKNKFKLKYKLRKIIF